MKTPSYTYYGGYILRKFCSIAPYLGLVPRANILGRKFGVSALVRIRNEPWIELSLLSIKDFADEIIVVDSSTDDTPERVKRAVKEHELQLKYIYKVCDLREAWQIALDKSSYEWIMKWDGDFVAYRHINRLKQTLAKLPKKKYYVIEFPHICLDIDFYHINKDSPYQVEGWLFKYSPFLKDIIEFKPFPKFIEKKFLNTVYVMHLRSVKPPLRLLQDSALQGDWIREKDKDNYESFEEFVKAKVRMKFGTENLADIAQKKLENLKQKLVPYSVEAYGDYPKILKNYVWKKSKIKL
jgi:glycosyltransferase involved in cell wall biosynthesis